MNISIPDTLKSFVDEQEPHIDVWRVVHGQRDMPPWMQQPDQA